MAQKPRVIVVDGEIGGGKSTVIKLLIAALKSRGLRAVEVGEPVDEWKRVGILQEFYADKPDEYRGLVAYDFQTFTFVTRVEETQKTVAANPDADVFVLERSVLTDRYVFMELQRDLVGPVRMEMYDRWWNMWSQIMPIRPQKIVYLKPTLENCQSRVETRARVGEIRTDGKTADETDEKASARGGVSAAYQARLRRAHEAYLQNLHPEEFPLMPPRPFDVDRDVVVVDGALADDDFSRAGPAADRVVSYILEKVLE